MNALMISSAKRKDVSSTLANLNQTYRGISFDMKITWNSDIFAINVGAASKWS